MLEGIKYVFNLSDIYIVSIDNFVNLQLFL